VIIFLLIGLLLMATSVMLVLRAFGQGAGRSEAGRAIARIDAYSFRSRDLQAQAPRRPLSGRIDALASSIGGFLSSRIDRFREDELRDKLQAAGMYATSPRKLMGYRLLLTLALPLIWLWFSANGGSSPIRVLFGFVIAAFVGWQGPLMFVNRRARMRLEQIDYEIPELIDLLVTTVEAGLSFSASLQMAARRFKGPLGQELRLALQEQEMGLATNEALENMLSRANTSAMRSFVRSVLQVETLGVSIGKVLRDLAIEMRKRRRQIAEERAQKAPTKMLFPLVLLIFPAIFLVLLGPAAIQILSALNGVG
jgi:tight adherence protein C